MAPLRLGDALALRRIEALLGSRAFGCETVGEFGPRRRRLFRRGTFGRRDTAIGLRDTLVSTLFRLAEAQLCSKQGLGKLLLGGVTPLDLLCVFAPRRVQLLGGHRALEGQFFGHLGAHRSQPLLAGTFRRASALGVLLRLLLGLRDS
ncbi:MAG: hypothetical protein ACR2LF_05675, partial [Jatrophihabitantaceae bacterium]